MFIIALLLSSLMHTTYASDRATTCVTLERLVKAKALTSIEQLLDQMPEATRSHYVLMHESDSKQWATKDKPRVILYWNHARTVAAFNSPDQAGGNAFECMDFNNVEARFEFHQIDFTSRAHPAFDQHMDCASCHFKDGRPNWNPYDSWPGSYFGDSAEHYDPAAEDLQLQEFARFLQNVAGEHASRYQRLVHPELMAERGAGYDYSADDGLFITNAVFTQQLGALNARRVARLIRSVPDYDILKYQVAGVLGCGLEAVGLVSALKPRCPGDQLSAIFEARGIDTRSWSMNFVLPGDLTGCSKDQLPFAITALGPLVEQDADLRRFFTTAPNSYHGSDGILAIPKNGMSCLELASRIARDDALTPALIANEGLQRLLRDETDETAGPVLGPPARPVVLDTCMECHALFKKDQRTLHEALTRNGFELLIKIKKKISPAASPNERMPPDGIDDHEKRELLDYLNGVARQ